MPVGIEISARTIKVVQVRRGGSRPEVTAALEVPRPDGPDSTPEADGEALRTALKAAKVSAGDACLGLTGPDLILRYMPVPEVPAHRLAQMMEFEIRDIAEKAGGALAADYTLLPPSPLGEQTALVALARESYVESSFDRCRRGRAVVREVSPIATSLAHAARLVPDDQLEGLVMVADLGDATSEVALLEDGRLIFARNLSTGADAFVQAIGMARKVDDAEARRVLRTDGALRGAPGADEGLARVLGGPAAQLAQAVQSTVRFAGVQLKRPDLKVRRILLSGGLANLPGLGGALSEAVGAPASALDPFATCQVDPEARKVVGEEGRPSRFTTALALAVARRRRKDPPQLSLLPRALKERLVFLRQTVWLYAAAGVLGLALLGVVAWWWAETARLDRVRKGLQVELTKMEERESDAMRREKDLAALEQEARDLVSEATPARNLLVVQRAIRRHLPREAVVSRIALAAPGEMFDKAATDEEAEELLQHRGDVVVQGRILEAGATGLQLVNRLEQALLGDPDVDEVQVRFEQQQEGGVGRVDFRCLVTPGGGGE